MDYVDYIAANQVLYLQLTQCQWRERERERERERLMNV